MTDDLVERIRNLLGDTNEEQDTIFEAADRIEELEAEIGRMAAALKTLSEADYPRVGKKSWHPDRPSKHDQCDHELFQYEACDTCMSAFARKALGG